MGLLISLLYILHYLVVSFASRLPPVRHRASDDVRSPKSLILDEASIEDLNHLQAAGLLTSVDLVGAYVQRTREVNSYLHAVSELNPDALRDAKIRDLEREEGFIKGPLHGIPILLKDNIATIDSLNNTAGSYALLGARPRYEATVARKLRNAGAVILGKATMGEWAQFRSSFESNSHGWSPLGGQVLGAYYPQQDPHGSSSGSAVAVSVGLSAGSLATETSGSIVNPAERNNVVGIKPTIGLTSRNMVIPISRRQDSVGPIGQTVKDAALILSAIAGKDPSDNWTTAQPFAEVPDYAKACKLTAFKGARLGVPRNGIKPFLSASTDPIMAAFEDALKLIEDSGAHVKDAADFPVFDKESFGKDTQVVLGADFAFGLADYLSNLATNPNDLHNLKDLVRFTRHHPLEDVEGHDLSAWDNQLKRNVTIDSDWSRAAYEANIHAGEADGVVGALERYDLDALVMPTFTSFHLPAIAGLPIVTVPLGFYPANTSLGMSSKGRLINVAPGIPFGIAFVGRKWSEETLISFAYAFEQRTNVRTQRKPLIRPMAEIETADFTPRVSILVHTDVKPAPKLLDAALLWKIIDSIPIPRGWSLLIQRTS